MGKLNISDIKDRSYNIFNQLPFVRKAFLFGSYARNEQTEQSDLDFLIQTDNDENLGIEFFGLYDYLQNEFKTSVDVITQEEADRIMGDKIKKDMVLIYER